jgi:hypothetical protein
MANLTQSDLLARGKEVRLRALIEDLLDELVQHHKAADPQFPLAMAVWFDKSSDATEVSLLELFPSHLDEFVPPVQYPLNWKATAPAPPFVTVYATSVEHFTRQLSSNPESLAKFRERHEVLYSDKRLLNAQILDAFNVITEPSGLMKGWYLDPVEYESAKRSGLRSFFASRNQAKPEIGLVKTQESNDFENCRGLLHVEYNQKWLPLSPDSIKSYVFYNDWLSGGRGYFLFEGGSAYQIQRFEVKTAPEYSARVLRKTPDDRYPEVYLRAVSASEQSAA